jgi:hypothetical protein
MSTSELDMRIEQLTPLVAAVCRTLRDEVQRLGFEQGDVTIGEFGEAAFWLHTDPASGEPSLIGEWRDHNGSKVGGMAFHADGSFFAEHDVVRTHPSKPRYFVEAVTAWGRDDTIKSEPRLLPMVS